MAAEFKDSTNHIWQVCLTVPNMSRIKRASEGRFDLFDAMSNFEGRTLVEVIDDDSRLDAFWEMLWLVIEPQAAKQSITPELFAERMAATERILDARKVFRKEWRDFFQSIQREDLILVLDKQEKVMELAHRKLKETVNKDLSNRLDAKLEQSADEAMSKLSGDLSELLALTQSSEPGASST